MGVPSCPSSRRRGCGGVSRSGSGNAVGVGAVGVGGGRPPKHKTSPSSPPSLLIVLTAEVDVAFADAGAGASVEAASARASVGVNSGIACGNIRATVAAAMAKPSVSASGRSSLAGILSSVEVSPMESGSISNGGGLGGGGMPSTVLSVAAALLSIPAEVSLSMGGSPFLASATSSFLVDGGGHRQQGRT